MGAGQDGSPFMTVTPDDTELIPMLRESGVDIAVKEPDKESLWMSIFISWFPMLLLIGVWIFFMRQMQMGGKGGALSFGKTRAKLQGEGDVLSLPRCISFPTAQPPTECCLTPKTGLSQCHLLCRTMIIDAPYNHLVCGL